MTITGALALFWVLLILAATPSSSVLLVVTRSATLGLPHGLAVSAGIVAGDLVFMTMAVFGMKTLATEFEPLFVTLKLGAAAYLAWLGFSLLRNAGEHAPAQTEVETRGESSRLLSSFAAGLFLTLGDIKAIFFYASLLPAFLDLGALTGSDILLVATVTIIAVGGVKAAYAIGAGTVAGYGGQSRLAKPVMMLSGGLLLIAAAVLVFNSLGF